MYSPTSWNILQNSSIDQSNRKSFTPLFSPVLSGVINGLEKSSFSLLQSNSEGHLSNRLFLSWDPVIWDVIECIPATLNSAWQAGWAPPPHHTLHEVHSLLLPPLLLCRVCCCHPHSITQFRVCFCHPRYIIQLRVYHYHPHYFVVPSLGCVATPCIRSARPKFELTNQDSAGGKNFTVLTSM